VITNLTDVTGTQLVDYAARDLPFANPTEKHSGVPPEYMSLFTAHHVVVLSLRSKRCANRIMVCSAPRNYTARTKVLHLEPRTYPERISGA